MTKRVSLVIEDAASRDSIEQVWQLERLVRELAKGGKVEASLFGGLLEAAPESAAYILFTSAEALADRATTTPFAARLPQTIATESHFSAACRMAETYGLLGALDVVASAWDPKQHSYLIVKNDVAVRLRWPISPLVKTERYARTTEKVGLSLPALLAEYLDASLA